MPHFNFDNIFDLEHWQDLQDSLADTTQLAISTIDYKGNPVSTYSNYTPFCEKIRAEFQSYLSFGLPAYKSRRYFHATVLQAEKPESTASP